MTGSNKLTIDSAANFGLAVGTSRYAGPLREDFKPGTLIDFMASASAGLNLAYAASSGLLHISPSVGAAIATLEFQNATLGTGTFGTLPTHS